MCIQLYYIDYNKCLLYARAYCKHCSNLIDCTQYIIEDNFIHVIIVSDFKKYIIFDITQNDIDKVRLCVYSNRQSVDIYKRIHNNNIVLYIYIQ